MNRQQAKEALLEGKTLRHQYFSPTEWVRGLSKGTLGGQIYLYEDGYRHGSIGFWQLREDSQWDQGWEIVETKQ